MARQDIFVDAIHGEVNVVDNLTNKVIYSFTFIDRIDNADNDTYCYAEIIVPPDFEKKYQKENGIRFYTPYKPFFKQLKIRFRFDHGNGHIEYMINNTNIQIWFPVIRIDEQGEKQEVKYSELYTINEKGNFNLILDNGSLILYSADETDFQFKAALKQNEIFLLKAFPSNLYQFPTTGVGLIDFLHGNFENTGLATRLKQEFENDRMVINDAYMNSATGELYLDVTEKDG